MKATVRGNKRDPDLTSVHFDPKAKTLGECRLKGMDTSFPLQLTICCCVIVQEKDQRRDL